MSILRERSRCTEPIQRALFFFVRVLPFIMFHIRHQLARALLNPGVLTVLVLATSSALAQTFLRRPLAPHDVLDWMLTTAMSALLWGIFALVRDAFVTSKRARRIATFTSAPLLALGLVASFMIYERLGEYLDWGMIRYAFESGGGSTQGFITTYTTWWHLVTALVLSVLLGVIWLKGKGPGFSPRTMKRSILGLSALFCVCLAMTLWLVPGFRATTPDVALLTATIQSFTKPHAEPLATSPPPTPPSPTSPIERPPDIILVIHESLGRQHLTWYQKDKQSQQEARANTPWLAEHIESEPDAWSIGPRHFTISTTTHLSVPTIWTGVHTSASLEDRSNAPMLWQWAKSAGYQTILATSQCYSWGEFEAFVDRAAPDHFLGCEDFPDAQPVNDAGIDELDIASALDEHLADLDTTRPLLLVYNSNALHQPFQTQSEDHPLPSMQGTDYERALQVVDEAMRELFDALSRHRTDHAQVVVMTADHGERPNPTHRVPRVESLYDEFTHIPIFWRIPEEMQTRTFEETLTHHNTSNLDILPTLLGLMGYDVANLPFEFDGVDLRHHVFEEERTILVTNVGPARKWHHTGELIVWGNYRLMRGDITKQRLYDIDKDPQQREPLDLSEDTTRALRERIARRACEDHGDRSSTCTAR